MPLAAICSLVIIQTLAWDAPAWEKWNCLHKKEGFYPVCEGWYTFPMFTQQRVRVNESIVQTGFISNIWSLIGFTNWIPSYIFEAKVCFSAGILFFAYGALLGADCPASLESVPSLFSAHTPVKYVKSSSWKKCPSCYRKSLLLLLLAHSRG